jgi:hypothetical protein
VADIWWRALPAGIDAGHWVAAAVTDTVAGGIGLVRYRDERDEPPENSPRFVLARGADGTLVGLACRARALSSELCQDEFGREIYCFVGWFTPDPGTRDIPAMEDLFPVPGGWASQVYEQYSAPVWTAGPVTLAIQQSEPGPAPWPGPPGRPEHSGELHALERHVRIYPAAMAGQLWGYGIESSGPFLLVAGWQLARQAPLERITHLGADDIAQPTTAARPLPRPEPDDTARSKVGQDSRLAATPLARQYQASQRAASSQVLHSPSLIERLIDWLLHSFNLSPPSPHQLGTPDQRPARPPSHDPRDTGATAPASLAKTGTAPASTATGPACAATAANPAAEPDRPGTTPAAPRSPAPPPSPPEIELPARRGTAKPFEGLE